MSIRHARPSHQLEQDPYLKTRWYDKINVENEVKRRNTVNCSAVAAASQSSSLSSSYSGNQASLGKLTRNQNQQKKATS